MVSEVQKIYRNQGVPTNDKHIEVIIRQMLKYQQITDPMDSDFLDGDLVNRFVLAKYSRLLKEAGKKPPKVVDLLLGISKASLKTESFLSAASFQETTKVLSNAAVEGRVDNMVGLKENVIIGRLVPVGTGQPELKNLTPVKEGEEPPALDVTRDDISIAEIIDRAEAQTSETSSASDE
jgi:DNA-directed RNA polymerase subunit beta'